MPGERGRSLVALGAALLLVLACSQGAADEGDSASSLTGTSDAPSTAEEVVVGPTEDPPSQDGPRETWATTSTPPPPTRPTTCSSTAAPDGTPVTVVVTAGSVACADAEIAIEEFFAVGPAAGEEHVVADGWACVMTSGPDGPATTCTLGPAEVVTAVP